MKILPIKDIKENSDQSQPSLMSPFFFSNSNPKAPTRIGKTVLVQAYSESLPGPRLGLTKNDVD